jgi:hypothetical protein
MTGLRPERPAPQRDYGGVARGGLIRRTSLRMRCGAAKLSNNYAETNLHVLLAFTAFIDARRANRVQNPRSSLSTGTKDRWSDDT